MAMNAGCRVFPWMDWQRRSFLSLLIFCFSLEVWGALAPPILPQPEASAAGVASRLDLRWSVADLGLIANGGFETGTFTGWTVEVQAQAGNMVINNGITDPDGNQGPDGITPPLAGQFNAVSVPMSPGRFGIYQNVTIPADASSAVLRWSDSIRNFEGNGTFQNTGNLHTFRAEVRNPANNQVLETMYQTENGDPPLVNWTKRSFDLTPYRGQTIRIAFVTHVFLFFFNVHMDNVSLEVETSGAATNEVYFGTDTLAFQGRTTNQSWSLPPLQPDTDYQWRVIRRFGGESNIGPVWTFTTGPVGELDHFSWAPIDPAPTSGQPFAVTVTARDARFNVVSSFQEAAELTAHGLPESPGRHLLGEDSYAAFAAFRRGAVGYSFTPHRDLWVHALRSFAGDEVSLWTEDGVRLAHVAVNQPPGQWTETSLPEVVPLQKGRTYRISAYAESTTLQYSRFEDDGTFTDGIIDQAYTGVGNEFPTVPHPARWWFVDLSYRTADPANVTLAPEATPVFQNGQWTGEVTLTGGPGSLILRAARGDDVSGSSPIFNLQSTIEDADMDGMPDDWETEHGFLPDDGADAMEDADGDGATNVAEYRAGTDPRNADSVFRIAVIQWEADDVLLRFLSVAGRRYRVEKSEAPSGGVWETIAGDVMGNGGPVEVHDDRGQDEGQGYYRVAVLP